MRGHWLEPFSAAVRLTGGGALGFATAGKRCSTGRDAASPPGNILLSHRSVSTGWMTIANARLAKTGINATFFVDLQPLRS